MKSYYFDCIIFGGGVCGVWIDAILQKQGYSTCLLEKNTIGGEQTLLSQGIIHKGLKYLLGNRTAKITNLLTKSADIWEQALAGNYEVDLSKTEIYADKQLIWNEQGLLASFFAKGSKQIFHSQVEKLKFSEFPTWLTHQPKHIFWLKEKIINSYSMMHNFYAQQKNHYYQCSLEKENCSYTSKEGLVGIKFKKENILLWTKKFILAAGKGNSTLATYFDLPYKAQLRPLTMLILEHSAPFKIYGHCITASSKPLFTISSHYKKNGNMLWYLGGKIAEKQQASAQKLQEATQLLQKNIKLNLVDAKWKMISVDRAEPWQKTGLLPAAPFVKNYTDFIVCSPVKLVFAPIVALEVKKMLAQQHILPCFSSQKILELRQAKLGSAFFCV